MAESYEYASATYGVGLEGLPVSDEEALNTVAGDGWEPMLMTSVHNGFAVLILFRRPVASPTRRGGSSATSAARTAKAAAGRSAKTTKATKATKAAKTSRAPARAR